MICCAIREKNERVHKIARVRRVQKLHEFDECNLLNEFNLFRIAQKSFNWAIIIYLPSMQYFYENQCININIQPCMFYDPFNSPVRIAWLCNSVLN